MLNNEIKKITSFYLAKSFLTFNYSISIDEALKILGLKKENLSKSNIMKKYNYLIYKNNPYKSGSFYLQCKIFNAKEKLIPLCNKNFINNPFSNISTKNILYEFKSYKNKNYL